MRAWVRAPQKCGAETMRYVMTAVVADLVLPAGAFAQPTYDPNDDPDYARSVEEYQSQCDTYAGQVEDYANRRDAYEDQRQAYARQRQDYERARAEYDAQYGAGAYERYYGPAPVYREYGYAAPTYRRYG